MRLERKGPTSTLATNAASSRPPMASARETNARLFDVPAMKSTPSPARSMRLVDCLSARSEERTPLRHLRWLSKMIRRRNALSSSSTPELAARFKALRQSTAKGSCCVPEALAIAHLLMSRTMGIDPYDVQMAGAMALFEGKIAKIRTGEGKTICAGLAAALFALDSEGTHVATTNAYLAHAGADQLRPFYEALGLAVGVVELEQSDDEKRRAYAADVVYGAAEVFAFDWLEDRLVFDRQDRVQRGLNDVIVDEADDVLIDSAQTPLVLAGSNAPAADTSMRRLLITIAEEIADGMDPEKHIRVETRNDRRHPVLTETGVAFVEKALDGHSLVGVGAWTGDWGRIVNVVLQTVYARHGVDRDREYINGSNGVVLVSSETGLPQTRSQWQDADLTAAIRRLEKQVPTDDAVALGEVTYRSFFGAYRRFAGMTGTTAGIEDELRRTYGKTVSSIPSNRPVVRVELEDQFFIHPALRRLALLAEVARRHKRDQPVLICTVSVAASKTMSERLRDPYIAFAEVATMSEGLLEATIGSTEIADVDSVVEILKTNDEAQERLRRILERQGIDVGTLLDRETFEHRLINAEVSREMACVVPSAGDRGAITVGTQIVGRGVDIPISKDVEALGGLYVAQDERQTNARKDEQVRGRAGRQGQKGAAQAFVSVADAVLTFLPAERVRSLCDSFDPNVATQPTGARRRRLENAVRDAQFEAETGSSAARQRSIEFDDVVEHQRRVFFERRDELRDCTDLDDLVRGWASVALDDNERTTFENAVGRRRAPPTLKRTLLTTCDAAWRELSSGTEERRLAAELGTYAKDVPVRSFLASSTEAFLEMGDELRRLLIAQYVRGLSP